MTANDLLRGDLRLIADLVPSGSRVLDLGCGNGSLLAHLRDERQCVVRGVELALEDISECIEAGIPVVQADLDQGLSDLPDASFDVVVLSQTLQVVRHPDLVLSEMIRVGSLGVVSFPNFAHWKGRSHLAMHGRMPVSEAIPYTWYETPNIHHTTLKDFRDLAKKTGARVVEEIPLRADGFGRVRRVGFLPNLRAETVVAVIASTHA